MSAGVSVVPDLRFPHLDSHVPAPAAQIRGSLQASGQTALPLGKFCFFVDAHKRQACASHTQCAHCLPQGLEAGEGGVHFLSGSGVEKGGADGVAAARVKPEPPEECRRCFWRAGAEFGLGLKGKMGD